MITLCLFIVFLLALVGGLVGFAVKFAWGLTKVVLSIVFCPIILLILVFAGLLSVAFPAVIALVVIMLIAALVKKA